MASPTAAQAEQIFDQRQALGLLPSTFTGTRAEAVALLYGMSRVRAWDTLVPQSTKDRLRRRRRRKS